MTYQRFNYLLFLYLFACYSSAHHISIDFPRLCVYRNDSSQYYPCVLNYIGLSSWSLYRCPEQSTFDEASQRCLVKVAVNDAFDQLASQPTTEMAQFHRVASFILATPVPNEDQDLQQQFKRLVSLPPTIDKLMEPFSMKKLPRKRAERDIDDHSAGVIWSHGSPLMRVDTKPIADDKPSINGKVGRFSVVQRHRVPVNEDELKYKKICYFTNWAQYRLGPAKFDPENIDPFLCTHIIYAFAYINNQTLLIKTVEDNDEELYRRINALKTLNPKLKTLLAVGGWNMRSYAFSTMVHHHEKRRNFIFDTINFLRKHNFDGLEIDWEYPGIRGGQSNDKYYLTLFLQEFKDAAVAQAIVTGQSRLILAAAVAANQEIAAHAYEIDKIAKLYQYNDLVSQLNSSILISSHWIFSDFHGAWQNYTGVNAPLYRRYDELDRDGLLNQDFGITIWLQNGAAAHKLVLGVPLFARSFLLARSDQNDLHSPTVGNGSAGLFTRTPGFLSYFEVCLLQTDSKWQKRTVTDGSESEYMFKDREWISYETLDNIRKRAAYVVAKNLGGMFVWSLDMDDFNGAFCNNGTYPYIRNSLALLPTSMPSYV
ncbi:unnamed protein product [Adineta ricciae]|uniref:chitinase n=1 Tax=Adineta ricciae TaxID=249248 RepID=A0A814XNQ9_ADIRI|nr:unnamed protein product [Adineta ricciae]